MKKALINLNELGRICEVVEPGQEFEVHEDFAWIDVPDDTTTADTYHNDGTITKFDPLTMPGFAENAYRIARSIAYTDVGNQLDMLYRELRDTGTISTDGEWFSHIQSIKTNIPKDDPAKVLEWNRTQWESMQSQSNASPV